MEIHPASELLKMISKDQTVVCFFYGYAATVYWVIYTWDQMSSEGWLRSGKFG